MRRDPHSYADDTQAETESFAWRAKIDFATKTLAGDVTLTFRKPASGTLDLDTRDLTIESVEADGRALEWKLQPAEPHLGQRLEITLGAATPTVRIRYTTSPEASALQWLAPAQTAGGKQPFLFSQCQAIHARSIIPLQDTPRLRVKFTAQFEVPADLKVVMAAADRGGNKFEMPQPIPPYLIAFAVGDLASRDLSPRCRVWAEPSVVEAAAWEYADVEKMITAAEALFGPYDWERFDILSMPPSFPYGGMENPRLTFLTPTIIAGDRSLVSVVAHELAHSWTGNLVTNANAEHFWLNEGFTMYAERRIVEALDGADMAALSAALGRRELDESFERFADTPEMTKLRPNLTGVDPDECYSLIPYEKGFLFLIAIERVVGRERFSAWLKSYLKTFRFGAITTDDFTAHIEAALPGALAAANSHAWLDEPGLPANAPTFSSNRLASVETVGDKVPTREQVKTWTPIEWALYIENLPRPWNHCAELDAEYKLTASTNYDVLVPWLTLAIKSGYTQVLPRVDQVLGTVGRMKYLRPLYTALATHVRDTAIAWFAKHRASYHPIARQMVEGVLAKHAG
jgi:leukotriene A-4 hydrolase/aminopeptidase